MPHSGKALGFRLVVLGLTAGWASLLASETNSAFRLGQALRSIVDDSRAVVFASSQVTESARPEWDDPSVLQVNAERPHATMTAFPESDAQTSLALNALLCSNT